MQEGAIDPLLLFEPWRLTPALQRLPSLARTRPLTALQRFADFARLSAKGIIRVMRIDPPKRGSPRFQCNK